LVVLRVVKGTFGVGGTPILNNFLGSWELLGIFFAWGFKYLLFKKNLKGLIFESTK